jgi:hypothetical protein
MDTLNCKEHTKKHEDVARRKKVKEEYAGSGNSSTVSVNSGLDQITKFKYRLDGPLDEDNV